MQSTGLEQEDYFDFLFKIILIGDTDVGKTSVIQRFKTGNFSERQQSTIGVDFIVRTLNIQGRKVKMQVWDTAGQERFRTITQSYYRSAHAAMITYDITRGATFNSVPQWIREMEQYGAANVLLALIGNKCDLESERQVEFNEACTVAKQKGFVVALETSAKEAQNVDQAFIVMAHELLARNGLAVKEHGYHVDSPRILLRSNTTTINSPTNNVEKKPCQC
ncbi:ras-related protein Rab-19 [Ictalurus furcatus]|uniref:ras-related protein Rab-19 n=1 Tax=Ictalurus furcatus TaxID=66913 RepID=UPI0023509D08|nr:ras-related protein Rab-19 [Ictalurus furcatus]